MNIKLLCIIVNSYCSKITSINLIIYLLCKSFNFIKGKNSKNTMQLHNLMTHIKNLLSKLPEKTSNIYEKNNFKHF